MTLTKENPRSRRGLGTAVGPVQGRGQYSALLARPSPGTDLLVRLAAEFPAFSIGARATLSLKPRRGA